MREIKFRAWDKKDKMMYYNIQKGIEFTDLSHYTFDEFLGNSKAMGDYHEQEVMQYIGLKDKNGVEIYEGDILEYQNPEAEGGICAVPELKYNNYDNLLGMFDSEWDNGDDSYSNIEVIGNIYENKDLIV